MAQLEQLAACLEQARQEIETLRHQEQEAALAAAENKQKVHGELLKLEGEMLGMRTEREQLKAKGTTDRRTDRPTNRTIINSMLHITNDE